MVHPGACLNRLGKGRLAVRSLIVMIGALAILSFAWPGVARAEVSAVYAQAQGTTLVVEVSIEAPPPSSLILVQNLPPGVTIVGAQPQPNNIDPAKGVAKWLLRNIVPGQVTIRMALDRPVAASEVSAEIRYMPAGGGGMRSRSVGKP